MSRRRTGGRSGAERANAPAPTSARQKLLLLSLGTLLAAGLLAGMELGLALLGWGDPGHEDPFVGFEGVQPLFVPQPDGGFATAEPRLRFFNAQSFESPARRETFRVFTLGGSTTYGRPYDDRVSFSRWLELLLAESDPGRRYEVVNAGGISYASYRVAVLMEELVGYEPDLFVVYTGHNEFLEDRTYPDLARAGPLVRALRRGGHSLRTVRLLGNALGPLLGDGGGRSTLPAEVRARLDVRRGLDSFERDDAQRAAILEHFRFNVARMIGIARDHGIPIVFAAPASNVRDFSPFKSQHAPALEGAALEAFETARRRARARVEAEDLSGARQLLMEAVERSPDHAGVHYELGRVLLGLGEQEAARRHLLLAKELDVCPLRAPEAIHRAVLEEAAAADVPVVDVAAHLERESRSRGGPGIPGDESFLDHVHPRIEVHQRIAEWILEVLAREGLAPGARLPGPERREALYARVLEALEPGYFAQRDWNLGKVLGWAGQYAEAAAALRRAVEQTPDDPRIRYDLGLVYRETGPPAAAVDQLRAAARLAPEWFEARFELGRALQVAGAWEEAAAALGEALRLRPGDARTQYSLARCHRALGRTDREVAALRAARLADPGLPDVTRLLGDAYERSGRVEEAVELYRKELERHPEDATPHADLAEALRLGGESEAAVREARRALELDPSHVGALETLLLVHRERGEATGAAVVARRLAALEPRDAAAMVDLGRAEQALERWAEAAAAFEEAIDLDPTLAAAHVNLGAVLARQGRLEAAVAAFEKGLALDPEAAGAHYHLASLQYALGRPEPAARHFVRAEALGLPVPEAVRGPLGPLLDALRRGGSRGKE